jgi:cytochrome c553
MAFLQVVSLSLLVAMGMSSAARAEASAERGEAIVLGAANTVSARSACHTCHGRNGIGDSSGAFPRLTGQAGWYLYKQMKDYASGLRQNEIMSPIAKELTDQQMQDVAIYYAGQTAPALAPPPVNDPLLLQKGAAIAATGLPEKGVAACVNWGQGLPPSFPYLAGQYATYAELQFRFWKEGQRRNDPLGVMEHIAKQLSDDEVRALATYFGTLLPPNAPQQASTAQ